MNPVLPRFGSLFKAEIDPPAKQNEKPEALVNAFVQQFREAADCMETRERNAAAMNDVEVLPGRSDVYVFTGEEARLFNALHGNDFKNALLKKVESTVAEEEHSDSKDEFSRFHMLVTECLKSAVDDFVKQCTQKGIRIQSLPVTLLIRNLLN
jgi:hypothetical protein